MSEYWSLLPWLAVPSLVLGLGLAWCIESEQQQPTRSVQRIIGGCSVAGPVVLVIIGVIFARDMRLRPAGESFFHKLADQGALILGLVELGLLAFLIRSLLEGSLSAKRKVLSLALAVAFVPLTLIAMLVAGQLLAGASL